MPLLAKFKSKTSNLHAGVLLSHQKGHRVYSILHMVIFKYIKVTHLCSATVYSEKTFYLKSCLYSLIWSRGVTPVFDTVYSIIYVLLRIF